MSTLAYGEPFLAEELALESLEDDADFDSWDELLLAAASLLTADLEEEADELLSAADLEEGAVSPLVAFSLLLDFSSDSLLDSLPDFSSDSLPDFSLLSDVF